MSILNIEALTSGYGNTVILREIDLELRKGEILCVLGRNGVGKSTLLKTIMGVLPVISGKVDFNGQSIHNHKPYQIANLGIAYAAQEEPIFPELTVDQNLSIGVKNYKAVFRKVGDTIFSIFPILKERLSQKAGTLSGGEKKMLLMARAMMHSPKLIVLDEITEGVQPSIIDKICDALKVMKENGTSVLLVEQNVDFAINVADYYALMNQGNIQEYGKVEANLKESIENSLSI